MPNPTSRPAAGAGAHRAGWLDTAADPIVVPDAGTILESITDAFVAVDRSWRYTYVNDRALRRMRVRAGRPGLTRADVLGRSMWDMFPDAVGTEIHRAYQRAMRDGEPVELESWFAPSGEWIETHAFPSPAGLSVYYRDVTARRAAEAERERDLRRHAFVADLGLRALGSERVQPLMDEAVALTARMLGSELAALVELLPDGERFRMRAGVGWGAGVVGRAGADPLGAHTIASGEPVVAGDVRADPRTRGSALLAEHGVASAATVVVTGRRRPFGALGFFSRRPDAFSAVDVSFLQAVANVLATVVERSHAAAVLEHARENERRRIARDLHDDALNGLTAALIEAGRLRARSLTPAASDELVGILRGVACRLRAAIYDLRLDAEEGRPFPERLHRLVEMQRTMTTGCDIELVMDDGLAAGAALGRRGTEVLRIVGEGLTNARVHAGVRHIRVAASGAPAGLRIEIDDAGRGFDPAAPARLGPGIDAMRERADLLGARLEIRSAPDAGTTVVLEVPPS